MIESTKKLGEKTTKKSLTQNLSKRLLELELKSNHTIKFSTFTFIVKKYCHYCKTCKRIA